jgi:iron complex outermembrane recepter protein
VGPARHHRHELAKWPSGGGYFLQKDYNLGLTIVSGIDLQGNYRYPLPAGWGSLSANLNGAYLLHDMVTPYPGSGSYDCAGVFGSSCQNGSPSALSGRFFGC